ncbi:MAG TPA: glycosyltransferase [Chthonomonadaceae bacterium]|nr:glycosyltransferase [Chthonomonadaceae bacterium]
MRVLVQNLIRIPELLTHRVLPGREDCADEILACGPEYPGFPWEPGLSWAELLSRCPSDWKPDAYIFISPEYNPIPLGVQEADCLTVGAFGDWNLGGQAIEAVGDAFDVLIADRNGVEMLRRKEYACIRYAPIWAHDPAIHRRLPDVERDIDILMLASFNHHVQWERAPWLARVARLSRRHRVVLTSGLFGDDYTRTMNRAKIVFNRSIRGELNMRAYEAPACGALMFYEASNPEVRSIFTDREDCVLYDAENLEDLLAYYLAPENTAERERIAEAGWRRVQQHTYAHHFAMLLNEIEPLVKTRKSGAMPRSFSLSTANRQGLRVATQWLYAINQSVPGRLNALLSDLQGRGSEDAELANLRAVALGEWGSRLAASPDRTAKFSAAVAQAQRALNLAPDYLLARFNLGYLLLEAGRIPEAEAVLHEVAKAFTCSEVTAEQLRGVYFPRRFETFDVHIERVWNETEVGSEEWRNGVQSLLLWRVLLTLGEQALVHGRLREAQDCARWAAAQLPDVSITQDLLGRAQKAVGNVEAAITAYRRTLELNPFRLTAVGELTQLYLDLQRPQEALTLLDAWAALLDGSPFYASVRPEFDQLHNRARQLAALPGEAVGAAATRLLAFPDWRSPAHWQSLVRAFAAAYGPSDAVLLMLRVEPSEGIRTEDILMALQSYLVHDLGLATHALPHITLLNQPLDVRDYWKLFHIADALLIHTEPPELLRDLATTACVPIRTLEDLAVRCAA